jgi:hypothetical protein
MVYINLILKFKGLNITILLLLRTLNLISYKSKTFISIQTNTFIFYLANIFIYIIEKTNKNQIL